MRCIRKLLTWSLLILQLCALPMKTFAAEPENQILINIDQLNSGIGTFPVGQSHTWIIRTQVPEDTPETSHYTVMQTLPSQLTYENGTLEVLLVNESEDVHVLKVETQYTLTVGAVISEDGIADRICVDLTAEGIRFATGYKNAELQIRYCARINRSAAPGTQILSTAQLIKTDTEGYREIFTSNKAAVSTGGFEILVTDHNGTPLSGAGFMLAHEAIESELTDPTVTIEILDTGNTHIAVVYDDFYTTSDFSESAEFHTLTDESGNAYFYGLAYGTYYLIQTESQEGFIPLTVPMKVEVNEVSHITISDGWQDTRGNPVDNTVRILNGAIVMPETGGPGTFVYTLSGAVVICSACLLLWFNRRRRPI